MTTEVSHKSERSFKPEQHLMQISRRQKTADGQWETVSKDYLEVAWRIMWFRDDYPMGELFTDVEIVTLPDNAVAAKATARVVVDGKTLGSGSGLCTPAMWQRWVEKAETTALGRALAAAGYGTQFCGEDDWDEGGPAGIVDSPIDRSPKGSATPTPARSAATPSQTARPAPHPAANGGSASATPTRSTGGSTGGSAPARQSLSSGPQFPDRPATEPQIKAIYAIARGAQAMDDSTLEEWCRSRWGKPPADLNRKQASDAIEALKLGAM